MSTDKSHLYFNGKPCRKCKSTVRYLSSRHQCVKCQRQRSSDHNTASKRMKDDFINAHLSLYQEWMRKVKLNAACIEMEAIQAAIVELEGVDDAEYTRFSPP